MKSTISERIFRGQRALELKDPNGASALVSPYGAQVLAWNPAGGADWIYLSDAAAFAAGTAIRGGIPVVFPQFAELGPLPKHGLVRTREWAVVEIRDAAEFALLTLRLESDPALLAVWPFPFVAELTVVVDDRRLDIELAVDNRGATPLQFTGALHTYLRVGSIERTRLEGIGGLPYRDSADNGILKRGAPGALVVDREIDRIFADAPGTLRLRDDDRILEMSSENFPDTVVWNPWREKAARLTDLPADGYRDFVCIEAAAVAVPVSLPAGECWCGRQSLTEIGER